MKIMFRFFGKALYNDIKDNEKHKYENNLNYMLRINSSIFKSWTVTNLTI